MQGCVRQNNIAAALSRKHERKGNHLTQNSQKAFFYYTILFVLYYLDFFKMLNLGKVYGNT